mgnify:CR=1 FL=1
MATIQFKRGRSTTLSSKNIILQEGEPVFEIDTGRFKIGEKDEYGNLKRWNDILYQDENAVVSRKSYLNFPKVGKERTIYIDESNGKRYRWIGYYEVITSAGSIDDISIIYGGDSNVNT